MIRSQPGRFRSARECRYREQSVNLASRNAGFINKRFDGVLAASWLTRSCTKPSLMPLK